ncbi:MAG: Rne/Rng family ribonuclease [Actinomycetota bacterium]|nr:Rne/Rng family ribonuclease [Actinomycetota bacterium]
MKKKKELLISRSNSGLGVAILEDGELAEIYFQSERKRSIVGNIYIGSIARVLPGMSAAFVDIGSGRNALLCLQDLVLFEDGTRIKPKTISKVLKEKDKIVVQVTKDSIGGKGARVTTVLGIPGRLMVYMPHGDRFGVSRKLSNKERIRLKRIASEIKPKSGTSIIRTAAQGARKKELEADLRFLEEEWERICARVKKSNSPSVVYCEPDLAERVVRDSFSNDFLKLVVDSEDEHRKVFEYLSSVAPKLKDRVELYCGEETLFEKFKVYEGIEAALKRKVPLPSGGHIAIDETEALTAIDVNTGSFIGEKSLEDTVLKTNLEAAREIVRQLRLRDIGGIIVIDFIDMQDRKNREKVLNTLEKELSSDRTKTQVVTLSRLGLVEMTRKNVTEGLSGVFGRSCSNCGGSGRIFKLDRNFGNS